MGLIIAFDCGTSSMKAAAIDETGRTVAAVDSTYRVHHPQLGWAEQDPQALWDVIGSASRQLVSMGPVVGRSIAAICFVAPWKHIIAVNRDGQVSGPVMIWMDSRAHSEAAELNSTLGYFVGTGQEYWPRLMWLKAHRPDVWDSAVRIVGLNSYFKWCATNTWANDPSDDFVFGATAYDSQRLSEIFAAAGLTDDIDLFVSPTSSTNIVGDLVPTAAQHLGLEVGTPVVGGFGDISAITVGAGTAALGDSHIYLGTSSWLLTVVDDDTRPDVPLTATLTERSNGLLYPLQAACLARDWVIQQTYFAELRELGSSIHDLIDDEVAAIAPGSNNLLATHWLTGELPPLSKAVHAMFINITPTHDRRHMVRAILESIAFTHRLSVDARAAVLGNQLDVIRVVGGGAESSTWMQIFADILQIPVEVPDQPRLVGVLGAFQCAAVGLGERPNLETAGVDTDVHTFTPRPEFAAVYERLREAYSLLHDAIAPIAGLLDPESTTNAGGS